MSEAWRPFLAFTAPGAPFPQQRARFARGHSHRDPRTAEYEQRVRDAAGLAMQRTGLIPTELPCRLTVAFVLARPSEPKHPLRPIGAGEGDLSNYLKSVEDAMQREVYLDDSQIVSYAGVDLFYGHPRTVVSVQVLDKEGVPG